MTFQTYQSRKYIPQLDGVRALAVLLVMISHYWQPAADKMLGRLGVTLFFVVSGYLITTLLLREERAYGQVSLKSFYVRRAFRIFPLYYLTLAIYCFLILVVGVKTEQREAMLGVLPADLFYFQEVPCSAFAYSEIPFKQSWSLGIEEKFYLVWPPLVFLLIGSGRRLRWFAGLLLCVFGSSFLLPNAGLPVLARCLFPYFHIIMGCLLAVLLHDRKAFPRLSRLKHPIVILLAAAAFVPVTEFASAGLYQNKGFGWHIAYSLLCTLIVASVILNDGFVSRIMSWRPLVFLGTISYGIYLIHLFALSAARGAVRPLPEGAFRSVFCFVLMFALAVIGSYILAVLIERPFIRFGRRLSERIRNRPSRAPADYSRVVRNGRLHSEISEVPDCVQPAADLKV